MGGSSTQRDAYFVSHKREENRRRGIARLLFLEDRQPALAYRRRALEGREAAP
ncbi:hypothetical protein DFR24_2095 [Panacagrimonas perspica]|uniref:Uncharacterized protein n=1 Tax=Panacagrimonas perspica TaxID=381431 RepID=A0A4R7PEQ5_9GAMM|nr:hypothetical protein DFR24_2095 [Panacagrimonas perspica]